MNIKRRLIATAGTAALLVGIATPASAATFWQKVEARIVLAVNTVVWYDYRCPEYPYTETCRKASLNMARARAVLRS